MALKHLVDSFQFITAVNYHAYGDMLTHPFNFAKTNSGAQLLKVDDQLFYEELRKKFRFSKFGPVHSIMGYTASGESDDWLYGEKGILSMTPEVGSEAGGFFPERADIKAIAISNFPFLRYVLLKTGFELSKVSVDAHHGTVSIFNGGLDSSFGKFIRLALLTTLGVIFREIEKISKRSNFTFDISAEKGEMIIIISSFCLIEDSVPVTCRCGAPGGKMWFFGREI